MKITTTILKVLDDAHSYGCGTFDVSIDGILKDLEKKDAMDLLRDRFGFFCWEDELSWESKHRLELPF